jgi:hypothetical protein
MIAAGQGHGLPGEHGPYFSLSVARVEKAAADRAV